MKYRRFEKETWEVSILGFGCMRLPLVKGGGPGAVDEKASIALIRSAIDRGVNYVDTAMPYHMALEGRVCSGAVTCGPRIWGHPTACS